MRFGRTRWPRANSHLPEVILTISLSISGSAAGLAQPPPQGSNPNGTESAERDTDSILLAEVVPALEGTELGALPIAPAPTPGHRRVVRRSEVLAALTRAGRSARGLVIPRSVTIRREARELDRDALAGEVAAPIAEALAPCEVLDVQVPVSVTLPAGELETEVDVRRPHHASTSATGVVHLRVGSYERRVPVRARLRCPPPAVSPGATIRIVAQVGPVRVSAPGEARQPGRVGDVIRVRNLATRASLEARIVDAQTVVVIR